MPRVKVGDSLRDALVAVLDSPQGVALVVDDSDTPCGTVTAAGVHAAARRSLASS
jgi:hypothetical protein